MPEAALSGELLLEVRVEEIPARMLPGAARELATRLFEELVARGLTPAEVETGYTPRRLWLILKSIPLKETDRTALEVGPPRSAAFDAEGRPTAAAVGFAKKFGVEPSFLKWKLFSKVDTGAAKSKVEGERIYLERTIPGRATIEVLAELIPAVLERLSWAKTMRWGHGVGPWVRPVHGVVALFAGEVVPFSLFGIVAGRTSAGHATLSPGSFDVRDAADWQARLAERGIVPSPEQRRARLLAEMERRAADLGGRLVVDGELLDKLTAICEIPGVLEGGFDDRLLALPAEVLATTLRDHQSALTVERSGALAPVFLTVMDRPDDPAGRVRAGNEWVVAARLEDARFFWDKDRARPLAARVSELAHLAFHERLGSYAQKSERVVILAGELAEKAGVERAPVERAASLAKADLVTEMVREFTALQGVVGGIYARADGEREAVWQAIYDQYRPAGSDDSLPRGAAGRVVALADRLDTLVGFFALGAKFQPTGSKDPFGLRRAAMGVVRIALEGGLAVDLPRALRRSFELHGGAPEARPALAALVDFLWDRAEHALSLRGLAYDEIAAARGATGVKPELDFGTALACAAAIRDGRREPSFLSVVLSYKRIVNILRDAGEPPPQRSGMAGGAEGAERALAAAFEELTTGLDGARSARDFERALAAVARFAQPLDRFFVEVLVMDPDEAVRRRRLGLLAAIREEVAALADLAAVVVDKAELRARAGA